MQVHLRMGKTRRTTSSLLALIATCVTAIAFAQETGMLRPNFVDQDLMVLIDAVSAATGRNIIVDPRVKGTITLKANTDMTPEEFWATFLAILQVNEFAAVKSGPVWKIVPSAVSRQQPSEPSARSVPADELTTQVIEVLNVQAGSLIGALRPLVAQYGHMQWIQGTNMIVVVDRAANVARIAEIVRKIDRDSDQAIEHIQLHHASAGEIVRVLTALNQAAAASAAAAGTAAAGGNLMAADDRTNAILLSGDPGYRLQMRTLIAALDTPLEGGGNTRVRYLHFANAEEMAERLQLMVHEAQQQVTGGQQGQSVQRARLERTNIWSDPQTNALIVTAPPKTMTELMAVIDKLDIRRAQVSVRAIIADVTEDSSIDLGINWFLNAAESTPGGVGIQNFPNPNISNIIAGIIAGEEGGDIPITPAAVGDGLSFAVGRIRDSGTSYAILLRALSGDANTNILGTPEITTLDNEEAEISVGQNVPFITGQFTSTGAGDGATNPFQTIQREDVGTKLKITPQISEGNTVIMDIELEVSSIAAASLVTSDVVTNKRTIKNSVIVEDGGIIVLGGLIDDQLVEEEQRVPGLGRIPIIGNLFRSRETSHVKRNLMAFIEVRILRDAATAVIQTSEKYNYMRNLQLQQPEKIQLMPTRKRPTLVPFDDLPGSPNPMEPRRNSQLTDGSDD